MNIPRNFSRNERIYIPELSFPEGDDRISMGLTQEQQDLVVGTLLGDASMQTYSSGQVWRYRALQKKEHGDFLDHKYGVLQNFCESPPHDSQVYDERTQRTYYRRSFNTVMYYCFTPFALAFYIYNQGKWIKDIPSNIEDLLSPRAVAYWYMDDGCLKWKGYSNAMRICTESYSEEGIDILISAMQSKYQIRLQKNRKMRADGTTGYRIAINEQNSSAFRELIRPHLVDCMKYKVSDGNKWHL
uniref:putative LAGLIDADG homing endonuclease n=1 Tax=Coelastrella saipanensis TaxID=152631 RepID=UPI0010C2E085|nr:putative LAGLIDADG homing endonuclease [Coelastrella saipanensis]YP_009629512.1 putative LAGLIDADG homing endonuclease [Coelastrella saipanensis]AVV61587.1 putative LAGLIDADG homing endonuclease [Coelastrella saipanensis]AVV61622.1 putative LAGLIDADG homing endonuclease [Coelastrella saipanensis]